MDHLSAGDVILADRGFDIEEVVAQVGAKVQYPAFTRGKKQLSPVKVESTQKIANVRDPCGEGIWKCSSKVQYPR